MRINQRDQVFTKDNQLLGTANRLYHRIEEARQEELVEAQQDTLEAAAHHGAAFA